MTEEPIRKLAVLLHADVIGSTALVQLNETVAHQRIQDAFRRFSETITTHNGIAHEIRGDALVAEFSRASDAVTAALVFQAANTAHNEELPDEVRPELRVGVAMGEVVVADNTVTGEGIVLAQRLEQLADPGGVCLQDAAYQTVPKRLPFDYENLGERQLKGFDEPVRAFAVRQQSPVTPSTSEAPPQRAAATLDLPDKPSIAVLSFDNMSGDPEQDYFSDGVTEDIITSLSHCPGLFVIARNSSFSYKGEAVDVKQVAEELGVRYVLEGSIRRAGNRIRINAQLIDAVGGHHLWAERYDRDLEDIFELQEEITRNIVGSIAPQIELAEVERGRKLSSTKLTAYELSLKALALFYDGLRSGNPKFLEEALVTAQAALEMDPRNTHALWTQAFTYAWQYLYRKTNPDEILALGWDVAERFMQVDPSNPKAYMSRAVFHQFRGDFDAAVADYRRALELNPNHAMTLVVMAWGESLAGHTKEAREHAELGLRLSPRDVDTWLGEAYLALLQASFAESDFEEAKKWGLLAVQMGPKAPIRRALMIASYAYTDDPASAARHAQELKTFAPDFIPSILSGAMTLYKMPEHNELLVDGLRKAGFEE